MNKLLQRPRVEYHRPQLCGQGRTEMKSNFGIAVRLLALILIGSIASVADAGQAAPAKPAAQTKPAAKPAMMKAPMPANEPVIPIQVIPQPASVTPGKGQFSLSSHTQIVALASAQA